MSAVIDVVPVAVALVLASVPLVMVSMALVIKRGPAMGWGFLVGWVLGLTIVSAVVIAFADGFAVAGGSGPAMGFIGLLAGLILLGLGLRKIYGAWRTPDGDGTDVPGWYSALETLGAVRVVGLGVALAALNPKNLLITVAAATAIADATAAIGAQVVAVAVFVVLGSIAIAAPVIGTSIAGAAAEQTLARVDAWVTRHSSVIVGTVLVVLGVVVASNGLDAI